MGKKTKFQWEADSGIPRDLPPPSRERSRKRREAKEVEALIDGLIKFSDAELKALPISEEAVEGLKDLRRLEDMGARGGLRRKRLQVAGLLRRSDVESLREALSGGHQISPRERSLQRVEHWRTRLLKEGDQALTELLEDHPGGDRQRLRQLVRQARKDQDQADPSQRAPKSFRELFAGVRSLIESAAPPGEEDKEDPPTTSE